MPEQSTQASTDASSSVSTRRPGQRRTRVLATVAAVVLLVAGLAGGFVWGHHAGSDSADTVGAVASRADSTEHDAADVRFAQMMLPHHEQALDMVDMVDSRSTSRAVRNLAAQIAAAQEPEIGTMTSWLGAWGATADTGQMDGMMTSADMDQLSKLSGGGFDREWLTMMIQHHEGAVEMARTEISDGENADALAMATSIQVTQDAQIAQMRTMLR